MAVHTAKLDQLMERTWREVLDGSRLVRWIREGSSDRRLYALYLIETFHYASHNAKNQALVGSALQGSSMKHLQYMKYCFKHALEEVGHEHMAYHDLRAIGLDRPFEALPPPLPMTEAFIAYLYWISAHGNPVQRLGYSYWAETSYAFITPVMQQAAKHMRLEPQQMTFFVKHADIDDDHAADVKHVISLVATEPDDEAAIARVLETTLRLTGHMLEDIAREYERLVAGESPSSAFLNDLVKTP